MVSLSFCFLLTLNSEWDNPCSRVLFLFFPYGFVDVVRSLLLVRFNFVHNFIGDQLVQALFAEVERLSNEKIRLASDTYELVDKHIRRLDNDSVKLQATIRKKYINAAAGATAKTNKNNGKY